MWIVLVVALDCRLHLLFFMVFFNSGCPREEGYLLIIIGVILGIVAIGAALLLIWKLLATIQVFYLQTILDTLIHMLFRRHFSFKTNQNKTWIPCCVCHTLSHSHHTLSHSPPISHSPTPILPPPPLSPTPIPPFSLPHSPYPILPPSLSLSLISPFFPIELFQLFCCNNLKHIIPPI